MVQFLLLLFLLFKVMKAVNLLFFIIFWAVMQVFKTIYLFTLQNFTHTRPKLLMLIFLALLLELVFQRVEFILF
jgi:hypothetical protein